MIEDDRTPCGITLSIWKKKVYPAEQLLLEWLRVTSMPGPFNGVSPTQILWGNGSWKALGEQDQQARLQKKHSRCILHGGIIGRVSEFWKISQQPTINTSHSKWLSAFPCVDHICALPSYRTPSWSTSGESLRFLEQADSQWNTLQEWWCS